MDIDETQVVIQDPTFITKQDGPPADNNVNTTDYK
jgi:hypothetical protein